MSILSTWTRFLDWLADNRIIGDDRYAGPKSIEEALADQQRMLPLINEARPQARRDPTAGILSAAEYNASKSPAAQAAAASLGEAIAALKPTPADPLVDVLRTALKTQGGNAVVEMENGRLAALDLTALAAAIRGAAIASGHADLLTDRMRESF